MKCKQPCPGFRLSWSIPFPTMITFTLNMKQKCLKLKSIRSGFFFYLFFGMVANWNHILKKCWSESGTMTSLYIYIYIYIWTFDPSRMVWQSDLVAESWFSIHKPTKTIILGVVFEYYQTLRFSANLTWINPDFLSQGKKILISFHKKKLVHFQMIIFFILNHIIKISYLKFYWHNIYKNQNWKTLFIIFAWSSEMRNYHIQIVRWSLSKYKVAFIKL